MRWLFLALTIGTMSFGQDSAQSWIERGKRAYGKMHLPEAAADFEKAISVEPNSAEARLCYGVACLFLYQNGTSEASPRFLNPDSTGHWSDGDIKAELQRIRSLIAEQNATNGKRAQENLRRALELDPRNELAMEYLASLYYWWVDPDTDSLGNKRRSRADDAQHIYKQIIELYPEHSFAYYVCGMIEWEKAFKLMRASTYPRPLGNEEARRSLSAQVSPLLDNAAQNLLRSLELDSNDWRPMSVLIFVRDAQAYVAATPEEAARERNESRNWNRKVQEFLTPRAIASGQPGPPESSASITFDRLPEGSKDTIPPFPPDPRFMIVPPPPPPRPPPGASGKQ